jgi:hypothetical protein
MKQKANFWGIPCFYDETTHEIEPRYGKVNGCLLSVAINIWLFLGTVFESCSGYFPIEIYKEENHEL